MVLIYTTCKNTEEAVTIGNFLVNNKLASCVNIWPMQSIYKDNEGNTKSQLEAVLYIKTLEKHLQQIEDIVHEKGEYETPFVGAVSVYRINRPYKEWMTQHIV